MKDPRAENDGCLSPVFSYCWHVFEFPYRDRAECLNTEQCQCTVYVRQPPTLKGAASDVAFHYILNIDSSRMDPRVPFDRFREVATCWRVSEDRLLTYVLPCFMTVCYWREEEATSRFHPKCLYPDPPSPIECDCRMLEPIEVGSSHNSWKRKHFGVQNVKLLFQIWTPAFTWSARRKRWLSFLSVMNLYLCNYFFLSW